MLLPVASDAQVMSFEDASALSAWKSDNGSVGISSYRYKFGQSSLMIRWKPGTVVTLENAPGLFEASRAKHGGIQVWFYDEGSQPADLQLVFLTADDREVCRMPFRLGFKGWRALWAKFSQDMGKKQRDAISKMQLVFPHTSGNLYIDMLEFPETVPWKYMEDAQYSTSRTNFSMIPDIMRYRQAVPDENDMIDATDGQIQQIHDRLMDWILGSGEYSKNKYVKIRTGAEKVFIQNGLAEAAKIDIRYNDDGTPIGEPLFTLDGPSAVEGTKLKMFRTYNEKVLIPLALDYHKNGNKASLDKIKYIYDWFSDQGWADGSSMGTIVLEKLRSAGYLYSYFLINDLLAPQMRERERNAMRWFTMFGHCYDLEPRGGTNSDDLRALANGRLIYALSIADPKERRLALTAFKRYLDKAMSIAPGGEDVIKDDFSGYHHRSAYNSGYYPQALYAGAQLAYILEGTPYAMSEQAKSNIKTGLKTFHFLTAGLDIPAGTVGRFPKGQTILHEMVPAYAYMINCEKGADKELVAIFTDVYEKSVKNPAWMKYVTGVNSDMSYMTTVGEMEAVAKALSLGKVSQEMKTGSLFMPYSGLLISKDKDIHFNVKGYSRHIWDYEAGSNGLNKYGRWMSHGHLEFFDFRNGNRSFHPADESYDWNHITGTTSKVLPLNRLAYNGKSTDHRNYSDQSFLAGVHGAENVAMLSFCFHDVYNDTSFRADKSYFFFRDMVVCIGGGVNCNDRKCPVATTIFQDLKGSGKQISENVYEDASFAYVVKEGTVEFSRNGKQSYAAVDHGLAPQNAGYEYYMLKDKSSASAVAAESPVQVLRRDSDAHIIKREGDICAALFTAGSVYEDCLVQSVNIPLAYILEDKGAGEYQLNLCEPDMRRPWKLNMNNLDDKEVAVDSQPFNTEIILDGDFDIVGDPAGFTLEKSEGKTTLKITTIHARNYKVKLKRNK